MVPACRTARRPEESGAGPLQLAEVLQAALSVPDATFRLPPHHWKILHALLGCRTERMGGHLYRCRDWPRTFRAAQLPQPALPSLPGRAGL